MAEAETELAELVEAALAAIQRRWRRWSWHDEALARRKPRMRAIHNNFGERNGQPKFLGERISQISLLKWNDGRNCVC